MPQEINTATRRARTRLAELVAGSKKTGETQEPFPKEAEQVEGYLNSKELQPPTN